MNILDRSFQYTPAVATDLRALFDRVQPGWNKRPKPKKQAKVKIERKK